MLTIQKPMKLTARASILQLNENFTERMRGNYRMIESGLTPEDMLHFLSAPPEVYLSEGEGGSLVDFQNTFHNQDVKIEVINDVLNRILVSDTYPMTYQDQTFIQSMLHRMGVTNVQEFVNQFRHMKQEIQNVSRLTELYTSESALLEQIRDFRKETRITEGQQEPETKEKPDYWLHQEIFNRLHTEQVYDNVSTFLMTNLNNSNVIHRQEMQVSQQVLTARNLTLNRYQNELVSGDQPLVYHYMNLYEVEEEPEVTEQKDYYISRINEAMLLNSLTQMYALRTEELNEQRNAWYQLADTVYQTAENTFRRMEEHQYQMQMSRENINHYASSVEQNQKEEIHALEQLYSYYEQQNRRLYETVHHHGDAHVTNQEQQLLYYNTQMEPETGEQEQAEAEFVTRTSLQQVTENIQERILELQRQRAGIPSSNQEAAPQRMQTDMQTGEEMEYPFVLEPVSRGIEENKKMDEAVLTHMEYHTSQNINETAEWTETIEQLQNVAGSEAVQILEQIEKLKERAVPPDNPGQTIQKLWTQFVREYWKHTEKDGETIQQEQRQMLEYKLHQAVFNHFTQDNVYQNIYRILPAEKNQNQEIYQQQVQIDRSVMTDRSVTANQISQEENRQELELVYEQTDVYEEDGGQPSAEYRSETVEQSHEERVLNQMKQLFEYQKTQQLFSGTTEQNSQTINHYEDTTMVHPEIQPGQAREDRAYPEEKASESRSEREIVTRSEVHQITKDAREELLKQQLDLINQQNVERYTKLQQLRAEQEKKEGPRQVDRRRAMLDGLKALENPQEALLTYLENNTETQTERIQTNERLRQIIGTEGVQILETLEQLQKGSTDGPLSALTGPEAQTRFIRDIARSREEAELIHRQEQESRHETVIREVQKEIERAETGRERARVTRREMPGTVTEEQLIHKQNENVFDEEFMEELRQQMSMHRTETRESSQTVHETKQVQEIVNNRVNEIRLHQNEDLERIISQNVSRQLGSLSEQVYGRLEKRMDAERRRRGL